MSVRYKKAPLLRRVQELVRRGIACPHPALTKHEILDYSHEMYGDFEVLRQYVIDTLMTAQAEIDSLKEERKKLKKMYARALEQLHPHVRE